MTHIPGRPEQCLESVCGIGQADISTIALRRTTLDQGPLSTDTRLQEHRSAQRYCRGQTNSESSALPGPHAPTCPAGDTAFRHTFRTAILRRCPSGRLNGKLKSS
jgi:hypothetical protein